MQWRNDQKHHEKPSFFHLASFRMLFFVFEKMSSLLPMLLFMLFAYVGKRSNSRSQMFLQTGVPKDFAIFTGKHPC